MYEKVKKPPPFDRTELIALLKTFAIKCYNANNKKEDSRLKENVCNQVLDDKQIQKT